MGREIVSQSCRRVCHRSLSRSRPQTIDDVSAQEHTVAVLQKTLSSTNVCYALLQASQCSSKPSCRICCSMVLREQARRRQSSRWPSNSLGANSHDLLTRPYLSQGLKTFEIECSSLTRLTNVESPSYAKRSRILRVKHPAQRPYLPTEEHIPVRHTRSSFWMRQTP